MKSIRSCCARLRKLGIPLTEQKQLAGVAVDAVFRLSVGGDNLQREAQEVRRDLLLVSRKRSETIRSS
jgi:hypothetical protein